MNATIITIGDELLIGQVVDTNSAWMGQELNEAGIAVIRKIAVGDERSEIIDALNEARKISDLILITGGLGPTKDDLTKYVLCEYFNGQLVFDEEIFTMVKEFFDRLNRPMIESNRKQAEIPNNCTPIKNYLGTAPGMWFEQDGKVFASMPGVPFEMKAMMKDFVIPKVKELFKTQAIIHKTIHTQGIGESFLAEKIRDIENSFPEGFKLAYLPNLSQIRLRITGTGEGEDVLMKKADELLNRLNERVGEFVFGYDNTSIEQEIGISLRAQKKTMGTAESLTGGLIAQKIASVPGASEYFAGSIIAYSNELKKNLLEVKQETLTLHGAASEQAVREMIRGALKALQTDYVVSVSGIAGPAGGTPEKPIGTVWIGVGSDENIIVKKFLFSRTREIIMELTAISALGMLWRFINGKLSG